MGKRIDLTDRVYNSLKVLRFSHTKNKKAYWICECLKCGNETKPIYANNLKVGHTKTCGSLLCSGRMEDLTGRVYNSLKVLSLYHTESGRSTYWICECLKCKNKTIPIRADSIKSGHTKTCGFPLCNGLIEDLTDKTFNFLKVLRFSHTKNGDAYWICECLKCGNKANPIAACHLKNGNTKTCGASLCSGIMEDLTGRVYNFLKILKLSHVNGEAYWICECLKCNKQTKPISAGRIKSGCTKTCNSSLCNGKIEDLTDKIFNFLKVLRFSHVNGGAYWVCECLKCNKQTRPIRARYLKNGGSKTCGCCKNINETFWKEIFELIYSGEYDIKQGYRPSFLKPQHIDITLIKKPNRNLFLGIEIDGEQHFGPIEYWGGEESFKKTQERDCRKNKLMKDNKHIIPYFLRIPYWKEPSEENALRILTENNIPIPDRYIMI